jgi:hypothetical protein
MFGMSLYNYFLTLLCANVKKVAVRTTVVVVVKSTKSVKAVGASIVRI